MFFIRNRKTLLNAKTFFFEIEITRKCPLRGYNLGGLTVTKNAYFSLLTHTNQLLLVTFCDRTAVYGASLLTNTHKQTGD